MAETMFRKILVPVDFSSCSEEAFRVALQLGHMFGSAIVVIHAIDLSAIAAFNRLGLLAVPSDAVAQRKRLRHHARLKMRQLLESLPADGLNVDRVIVEGTPFVEIGKFVRQARVELIVLGSYGGRSESMEKIFFGATAEKVIRTAGCAVLTVPLPAKKTVS
jgi:nucleotide-binding universal stress UspA family protein